MAKCLRLLALCAIGMVGCNNAVENSSKIEQEKPTDATAAAPGVYTGVVDSSSDYWSDLYTHGEWLAFCDAYVAHRRDQSNFPDQKAVWDAREKEIFEHLASYRGYEVAVAITRATWNMWRALSINVPQEAWPELYERYDNLCGPILEELATSRKAWLAQTSE